jgi:hypothetical protein
LLNVRPFRHPTNSAGRDARPTQFK